MTDAPTLAVCVDCRRELTDADSWIWLDCRGCPDDGLAAVRCIDCDDDRHRLEAEKRADGGTLAGAATDCYGCGHHVCGPDEHGVCLRLCDRCADADAEDTREVGRIWAQVCDDGISP